VSARVHMASISPVSTEVWRAELVREVQSGSRIVTLFGREHGDGHSVAVTAILQSASGELAFSRTLVDRVAGYHALTDAIPAFHCFERELHEQRGVALHGHPWLKPVRFEGGKGQVSMNDYPYYSVEGKDVHEVAVGPIHAGVIEPGSFRFMCHGERVLHLEIQLGYQHRGVERLLLASDLRKASTLVEAIAGDTSVGHTWAYASAIERLAGADADADPSRGLLLELERIAMHLATLSGLAADLGFLQGATTYGRLRTTVINTTMWLCGSRFGRSGVRPGGAAFALTPVAREKVLTAIKLLEADLPAIDARFLSDRTVRHRLGGVGVVSPTLAAELGLVGLAARASGIAIDQRLSVTNPPIEVQGEGTGDCLARTTLRVNELHASLRWVRALLAGTPDWERVRRPIGAFAPSQLVIALVEGWRGELVHCVETDMAGRVVHYKVQDPSLRNWMGLAMAVRGNDISDFPICNKSFDLSYCGHDL
jgi:Ni,Fe-hydrogenase III large subunit